jgi:hypothetical protein
MLVAIVPLLACVIGLVLYLAVTTNAKVVEVGRALFWCGLLVTLFAVAGETVRLF